MRGANNQSKLCRSRRGQKRKGQHRDATTAPFDAVFTSETLMRGRRERRDRAEEARFARTRVQLHRDKAASGYCTAGDSSNVLPWASGEGLVLEPQAALTAATAAARSNWSVGGLKRCAIIVDRHTHKNGGSTVRDIFLENERLGYGLYQGYTQLGWNSDWRNVRRLADAAVGEGRTPSLLLMIEATRQSSARCTAESIPRPPNDAGSQASSTARSVKLPFPRVSSRVARIMWLSMSASTSARCGAAMIRCGLVP